MGAEYLRRYSMPFSLIAQTQLDKFYIALTKYDKIKSFARLFKGGRFPKDGGPLDVLRRGRNTLAFKNGEEGEKSDSFSREDGQDRPPFFIFLRNYACKTIR